LTRWVAERGQRSPPSVGFAATSPEVFPSGEERCVSRSSPAPKSAGEVSAKLTEGAQPELT